MSKTITLNQSGGNFMFINTLAHDPCHDWNPNGNVKRLKTIESCFKRLTNQFEESMNGGSIKRNKILKGGETNEEEETKITDYLYFEDDSSLTTLINY